MNLPAHPPCRSAGPSYDVAQKLAALSHPARIEIVARIAGLGACSCKDVVACLELAQSTVSQHLKILVDAGLVKYESVGQRSRYEIDGSAMVELSTRLAQFAEVCCGAPERSENG